MNTYKTGQALNRLSTTLYKPDCGGQPVVVNEPRAATEFEIQAGLFAGLQREGYRVRGEVTYRHKEGGRRVQCRFDLALFDNGGRLVYILEVKAAPVKHKTDWMDTRQGRRYTRLFGVPVLVVYGAEGMHEVLKMARDGRFPASAMQSREAA